MVVNEPLAGLGLSSYYTLPVSPPAALGVELVRDQSVVSVRHGEDVEKKRDATTFSPPRDAHGLECEGQAMLFLSSSYFPFLVLVVHGIVAVGAISDHWSLP